MRLGILGIPQQTRGIHFRRTHRSRRPRNRKIHALRMTGIVSHKNIASHRYRHYPSTTMPRRLVACFRMRSTTLNLSLNSRAGPVNRHGNAFAVALHRFLHKECRHNIAGQKLNAGRKEIGLSSKRGMKTGRERRSKRSRSSNRDGTSAATKKRDGSLVKLMSMGLILSRCAFVLLPYE